MRLANRFASLCVCVASLIVVGCGGGGSSGGSGSNSSPGGGGTGRVPQPESVAGTVSGVVQDGVVSGADVKVYAWTGQKGELLASGATDSRGRFSLQLNTRRDVPLSLLLEATGGRYTEETTGQLVSLKEGQALMAVQNYTPGQALTTSLTYYTTLIAALAENLVRLGMPAAGAVQSANNRISSILGFDVGVTQPTDVAGPEAAAVSVTREVEYGFATAGLSSFTEVASVQNNTPTHVTFNSIALIQSAYQDLRFDGLLDGRGESGALFFGNIPLTTDIYRHELALHILRAANTSAANRLGVPVDQLQRVARALNDSNEPIFSAGQLLALDSETPNILNVTVGSGPLVDGSVLFGSPTLVAAVASFAGAGSAELLIDDVLLGQASDPNRPSFAFDTTPISDGPHRLTLRVVDIAGARSERSFDVMVSNRQTTISNISIKDGAFLRGTQRVSAVINDPVGISKIDYLVEQTTPNGVLPTVVGTLSDPRLNFDFDTTVIKESGRYSFVIAVTNNAGVTTRSQAIRITIDNVPPTAFLGNTFRGDGTGTDPNLIDVNKDTYNGVFRVGADAFDDQVAVTVRVFVDGVSLPIDPLGDIFDQPGNVFIVDTTQFQDGLKTLVVIATDSAGNQNSATRQITFDN